MSGLHLGCLVAFATCWLGAIAALALPGRPEKQATAVEWIESEPLELIAV